MSTVNPSLDKSIESGGLQINLTLITFFVPVFVVLAFVVPVFVVPAFVFAYVLYRDIYQQIVELTNLLHYVPFYINQYIKYF